MVQYLLTLPFLSPFKTILECFSSLGFRSDKELHFLRVEKG